MLSLKASSVRCLPPLDHALLAAAFAAVALAAAPAAAAPVPVTSCNSLSGLSLPHATVTAQSVPAGSFTVAGQTFNNLPGFCRVIGVSTPSPDSHIGFELWIPDSTWNTRYQQSGNGGFAGAIPYGALAGALQAGYAAAGTDDGHTGGVATFAVGHHQQVIDFGFRALKETTDKSKALIAAFYGRGPSHSYFVGCSDGGREALMEAQRFPEDFDGISAGAPANDWTHLFTGFIWNEQALFADPASKVGPEKLPAIQQAALAQCDKLDGVADGILNDQRQCHFDPAAIQSFFGNQFFTFIVFEDPAFDFRALNFDTDVSFADHTTAGTINSTDPDLSRFRAHGGKLLQWHGWDDPAISPRSSIAYFESVAARAGRGDDALQRTQDFYRLFLAPGVLHCGGGPGPNVFDTLTPLVEWVEQGTAPERIVATKFAGDNPANGVLMTRPLCPFPTFAEYRGKGSTNEAANFVCREQAGSD